MLALYNKYRPRKFSEVSGQKLAKNILIKNIQILPFHAFIFYGTRGTGKTTLARIFAKSLNCSNFNEDLCQICIEKTFDTNILEISSSSRGIDEIKEIFSFSTFLPLNAPKKVIIFDEAQMLTGEAFGFLLKKIEECFQHITYIFVTTEINKIPSTIVSRCQKIPFFLLNKEEVRNITDNIIKKENINISSDILDSLLRKTNYIPRDTIVLLEEVRYFENKYDLEQLLNHETLENFNFIYESILNKDFSKIQNFVDEKFALSISWKNFFISLINFLSEKDNFEKSISNFYVNFSKKDDLFFSRSFILFLFKIIYNNLEQ